MTPTETCRAILVRRTRWAESSLVITWLTDRFGALRTVARGALRPKSPFAGKVDLFHQGEITFALSRASTLHSLREMELTCSFSPVGHHYEAVVLASYFAELSALVAPPMQPAMNLHDLLTRALNHLRAQPPTLKALEHFEREVARILGVLDVSGKVHPVSALTHLCGRLPAGRSTALGALGGAF